MRSESCNASSGGVSFFSLLTLLFIGLKLGGVIDWSWWLVLAPLWICWIAAALIGFTLLLILVFRG